MTAAPVTGGVARSDRTTFSAAVRIEGMDVGFDLGANVPFGVFALHAVIAVVFLGLAGVNGANGETIGLVLYLAMAGMIGLVGVMAARIVARR
ncbi:hypothetical protein C463_16062 [Halorubrum californiense DSM 19288]|uniref:Uncharacterized protein n=2 Tax=Haloferacaceae TaxID=1644056 RepID=M0DZ26_9EURY|nr:hypothetical protein C463_16062 [Halorubrum californiense DSM 19288]